MNAEKMTSFGPHPEDFGALPESDDLIVAPLPEPAAPRQPAGDEWKAGIMAHFTQLMSAALDEYAARYKAELAEKEKDIAELERKAAQDKKDADAQRLKLSFDLQIVKAVKAKVEDRLKVTHAQLDAVKARDLVLEDAVKVHDEQLVILQSENAALEARVQQREGEHSEALKRESEARVAVNDKNDALKLALTTAQDEAKEAKDKNAVLATELAAERETHTVDRTRLESQVNDASGQAGTLHQNLEGATDLLSRLALERDSLAAEKTALEAKVQEASERIFTLERNAHSVDRRNVQTRSGLAQKDKHLLLFKAHAGNVRGQHEELRQLAAALMAENSNLRTENSKLVTARNLALQDSRRLQAPVPRASCTPPQARQAVQQQPDAEVSGERSSYGFSMLGNLASSTVSAITGSPRSLYKAMVGLAVVGSNDDFTSPV